MHLDTFVKTLKMPVFHRKVGGLSTLSRPSLDDHEISASTTATDLLDGSYESYSKGDGYRIYVVILCRQERRQNGATRFKIVI